MKWSRYVLLGALVTINVFAAILVLPFLSSNSSVAYFAFDDYSQIVTALIALVGLLISTVGTVSTLLFSWRSERRQAQEFLLRIEHLEIELSEARERHSSGAKTSN
jgi:hypothetical protein